MEENYKGYADGEVTISSREYRDLVSAYVNYGHKCDECYELKCKNDNLQFDKHGLEARIEELEAKNEELANSKDCYWKWYSQATAKSHDYEKFFEEHEDFKASFEKWKEEKNGNKDNN